jgi:hypothetical protein
MQCEMCCHCSICSRQEIVRSDADSISPDIQSLNGFGKVTETLVNPTVPLLIRSLYVTASEAW